MKKEIIRLLDKASNRDLRVILVFLRTFLGEEVST